MKLIDSITIPLCLDFFMVSSIGFVAKHWELISQWIENMLVAAFLSQSMEDIVIVNV